MLIVAQGSCQLVFGLLCPFWTYLCFDVSFEYYQMLYAIEPIFSVVLFCFVSLWGLWGVEGTLLPVVGLRVRQYPQSTLSLRDTLIVGLPFFLVPTFVCDHFSLTIHYLAEIQRGWV